MSDPILILFAKAPRPGKVKTRLQAHCGAETAARIATAMLERTAETAAASWGGPVRLVCGPSADHPDLRRVASRYGFELSGQSGGDLGEKMERAIIDASSSGAAVALMGCDLPDVTRQMLRCAFERLKAGTDVLGPTADGGFYFIGLQKCVPGMMRGIPWSTSAVAERLIRQANALDIRFGYILECLQDVDTWDDMLHAARRHQTFEEILNGGEPAGN